MEDVLFLAGMLLIQSMLGMPIARRLGRHGWLIAAPLGTGIATVVSTVAYVHGAMPATALEGIVALATVGGLASLRDRRLPSREELTAIGIWLLAAMLILLPKLISPEQFAVFQGNIADTFGYLSSAAVYARHPFAEVMSQASLPPPSLFPVAAENLLARPSAHLLFATFAQLFPRDLFRLHYTYLSAFGIESIGGVAYLAISIFGLRLRGAMALAALFGVGFWGQIILDINSWSEAASMALLPPLVALVLNGPPETDAAEAGGIWTWIAQATLFAGALFLYPENFTLHLAAMLGALALLTIGPDRSAWPRLWQAALAALAATIVSLLHYDGIIGFVIRQLLWARNAQVDWHIHFFSWLFGRSGGHQSLVARAFDFLPSLLGYYFYTPGLRLAPVLAWPLRIAELAFLIGCLRGVARAWPRSGRDGCGAPARLILFLGLFSLITGPMLIHGQFWQAGKALTYVSPYLFVIFLMPLVRPGIATIRGCFAILALLQIHFAIMRVAVVATHPDGIHFAYPYPAVQGLTLKLDHVWKTDTWLAKLSGCSAVRIAFDDKIAEPFARIVLLSRGVPIAENTGRGICRMTESPGGVLNIEPGEAR